MIGERSIFEICKTEILYDMSKTPFTKKESSTASLLSSEAAPKATLPPRRLVMLT